MILVSNYILGMLFCLICCICWGSWANTQKLVENKEWEYPLFYWDYVFGFCLTALIAALTVGSFGGDGESFMSNLSHAAADSIFTAIAAGMIWNCANVFLTAAISTAGMSVGFPIGGGIGWLGGVVFNYLLIRMAGNDYPGNQWLLWTGLAFGILAIILCSKAYGKIASSQKKTPLKGILMAIASGIGFMFFYGLVQKSVDPQYVSSGTGSLTPFSAVFFFAVGVLLSTPVFNGFAMRHPNEGGKKVTMKDYIEKGDLRSHLIGMLGGFIWMFGLVISMMSSGVGNPAVNYGLSNASPVVAMVWGVFIWKEFKNAPKGTNTLITLMFLFFITGLVLVTLSNN